MKNYLLLTLLSLCNLPSSNCAECRELQEKRPGEQAHKEFLDGVGALNTKPEIIDIGEKLDAIQNLIDRLNPKPDKLNPQAIFLFTDEFTKAEIDEAISYLNDTDPFTLSKKHQKRTARLLEILKTKTDIIEKTDEMSLFDYVREASKFRPFIPIEDFQGKVKSIGELYVCFLPDLTNACLKADRGQDYKKNLSEMQLKLCPMHGLQNSHCTFTIRRKNESEKEITPFPIMYRQKHLGPEKMDSKVKFITQRILQTWKNTESPGKDLREGLYNILEDSKIFEKKDYQESGEYKSLIQNAYVIYGHVWTCDCKK